MKFFVFLSIFPLFFLPVLSFSRICVSIRPGLSFYNDATGYFVRANVDFLQPVKNLNIGTGVSLNGASFNISGVMNTVLFGSFGYSYSLEKILSLPLNITGTMDLGPAFGLLKGESQSSVSQIGLAISPSASVTYALNKSFHLGLFFSYHLMIYQQISSFIGLGLEGRLYFH